MAGAVHRDDRVPPGHQPKGGRGRGGTSRGAQVGLNRRGQSGGQTRMRLILVKADDGRERTVVERIRHAFRAFGTVVAGLIMLYRVAQGIDPDGLGPFGTTDHQHRLASGPHAMSDRSRPKNREGKGDEQTENMVKHCPHCTRLCNQTAANIDINQSEKTQQIPSDGACVLGNKALFQLFGCNSATFRNENNCRADGFRVAS